MEELQARMSHEEFFSWQAFLRRYPRGLAWENWAQANLARHIDALQPRPKGAKLPAFEKFVWKAPEPLFVGREKENAKRRKKRN